MYTKEKLRLARWGIRAVMKICRDEWRRGTLHKNFRGIFSMDIQEDMSFAELLEEKAARLKNSPYCFYKKEVHSYRDMEEQSNRTANFIRNCGGNKGKGLAIMMSNSPRFLHVFFASQKLGMYAVPVNTSLRGESLLYLLNHSEAEIIVIDIQFLSILEKIHSRLDTLKSFIVNDFDGQMPTKLSFSTIRLSECITSSSSKPDVCYRKEDICYIMYTSGTTGLPKGVVYRYGRSGAKLVSLGAHLLLRSSDVLYTCLPLFHGNALFLTAMSALHVEAQVVIADKFSARTFWEDIRNYQVTTFNTIGAMIPILIKQPPHPDDNNNSVRFSLSAACPVEHWQAFEQRFGIKIFEGYGAIDGAGKGIFNFGQAPVGSIGKPLAKVTYRIIDAEGKDCPVGEAGELAFKINPKKGYSLEYFKNTEATEERVKSEWMFTGDRVRKDQHGYLYFVGRNTESMRIKGENVSAYEVEQILLKHPQILETAVYAVPSELAEDEICAAYSTVIDDELRISELKNSLSENLPHFAIPRYYRKMRDFPKTATQRIIKKDLEIEGLTSDTFDSQLNLPCGKIAKPSAGNL